MLDIIKKSFLASLGAAVVTKEKIEAATKKLVDDGKLSMDEAEKLSKDLVESGSAQWEEFQEKISSTVKKALHNLDVVRRKDLQDLNEKVEDLEKRLAAMEKATHSDQG